MRCRTGISGEITLELFFKVGEIWPGSSGEEQRSRCRDWSKQRQRAVRAWRALVRLLRAVRGPGLTRGGVAGGGCTALCWAPQAVPRSWKWTRRAVSREEQGTP